jgi:hypothetical protein
MLPLFDHDLMDPLARDLEMLGEPGLVAFGEAIPLEQVADGDPELLGALWVPLGHDLGVSVSLALTTLRYDARTDR